MHNPEFWGLLQFETGPPGTTSLCRNIEWPVRHALTQLGVEHPAEMRHWIGPPLRHSFAPLLDHDHDRIELAVRSIRQKQHLNRLRVNAPPTFALRWLLLFVVLEAADPSPAALWLLSSQP